MFKFKRIESDSGLEFDHRWRRSIKIGAVTVFESVRLVAYTSNNRRLPDHWVPEHLEVPKLIYFRGAALDEEYQKWLSMMGNSSTKMLRHLATIMWLSLYVILNKIIMKELVIKNAEYDTKWHKKWPFAADQFLSVKRNKKLKQLGL